MTAKTYRRVAGTADFAPCRMYIEGKLYDFKAAGFFPGKHYFEFAVCRNCDGALRLHIDSKCLFASTTFVPVTQEKSDGSAIDRHA